MKRRIVPPIQYVRRTTSGLNSGTGGSAAMRFGRRYEAAFFDYISDRYPGVLVQPWLEYEDANGYGLCQPDCVLLYPLVVFEVKTKFSYRRAYGELRNLYGPLIEHMESAKPRLVQVCRYLAPSAKRTTVVHSLADAIDCEKPMLTLNWRPI